MEDAELLAELTPVAASLYERHLSTSREWFPHDKQPWHLGAELDFSREWTPDDSLLSEDVRSALLVNVLTEDNLPYYFRDIERMFSVDEVWAEWTRRWTAEEGRHAIAMRDYMVLTKSMCPIELERARMAQVSCGETPSPVRSTNGFAYLTLQELATRISHHNTGKLLDDPAGYEIMKRVAADENFHYLFYRDAAKAAIELAPSDMVIAIEQEVRDFEMPGTGIVNFSKHARRIAQAGIYDFTIHHDSILVPVVYRHWDLENIAGLNDEAEAARDRTIAYITRLKKVADRMRERAANGADTAEAETVSA